MMREERDALVMDNLPWIKCVVAKCRRGNQALETMAFDDLLQEALAHMLERVHRWDPGKSSLTYFINMLVWHHLNKVSYWDRPLRAHSPHKRDSESRKAARARTDPAAVASIDFFRDHRNASSHPAVFDSHETFEAKDMLRRVPAVYRQAVSMCYGIGEPQLSLAEAGRQLGVSDARVAQRRDTGLKYLRRLKIA